MMMSVSVKGSFEGVPARAVRSQIMQSPAPASMQAVTCLCACPFRKTDVRSSEHALDFHPNHSHEGRPMILDFHTHVMPPEMAAAPIWQGKCPMTIENVFEAAKAGGIDKTVI